MDADTDTSLEKQSCIWEVLFEVPRDSCKKLSSGSRSARAGDGRAELGDTRGIKVTNTKPILGKTILPAEQMRLGKSLTP